MESFKALPSWPVDNVAAAVIAHGEVSTFGDSARVFELMSVTKLISAYGFLIAVEEGLFELDDPLGPEGSTVRHLLAHASGVGFDSPQPERGVAERRIYSSAGFDILADAVASESGMSFSEYLREAVLAPLGMARTELWGSAGHQARSCLADCIAFGQELITPTLLSQQTLAEAFSTQFPNLDGIVPGYGMQKPNPWGLGFEIKGQKSPHWTGTLLPPNTVGHFGQSGTFIWMVPGSEKAAIVLSDRAFGAWAKPLWTQFNDAVWGEL